MENQRREVEQLARARGFSPVWFEESESAVRERPEFSRMLEAVRRGEVSAVAVWALDRLHRSMAGTVADVLELDRLGVRLLSVRESWLDTAGPVRGLLVAILGWVAEQERTRLVERTRAGMERARAQGKHLGRPPRKDREAKREKARTLRAQGLGWRAVGRELGVDPATARRWTL